MPPPPLPRKKPFVFFLVIGFALLLLVSQALQILRAVSAVGEHGVLALLGTIVIGGLVMAFSGWVLQALSRKEMRNPALLKVYLWCMLLIYPATNIAKAIGFYNPLQPLSGELLFWSAVFEILRYLTPVVLLVWIAKSSAVHAYFAKPR